MLSQRIGPGVGAREGFCISARADSIVDGRGHWAREGIGTLARARSGIRGLISESGDRVRFYMKDGTFCGMKCWTMMAQKFLVECR
jgi:hypothetical protein